MADLKHHIPIDASPQAVYAAIATKWGLASWWTADTRVDENVDGNAGFGFNKRSAIYRMTIKALDPGKQVVWTCQGDNPEWTGTTLSWTIAPDAHGSMIRFTHGGWRSANEMFAACNSMWGELMYRLRGI